MLWNNLPLWKRSITTKRANANCECRLLTKVDYSEKQVTAILLKELRPPWGPHFWRPHSLVDTRQQAIIRSSLKVGVGFPRRALELSRRRRLSGACRCRRPLPRLARPSLAACLSGDSVHCCASLAVRSRAARRRAAGNQDLPAAPLASAAAASLSLCPEVAPYQFE